MSSLYENENKIENGEKIEIAYIEDEISESYLNYSMAIIVGRALPDVRDGLKPVHRRSLFGMYELSNTHDKQFKKSARIVGEVLGKFHPHGDTAVYESIVGMVQDFKQNQTLIEGHGNFGSIDGDSAAAMRYTEIRMTKYSEEILLQGLDKNAVEMQKNFDETLMEPSVLNSRVPQILINPVTGIAVGMATSMLPHNLGEVIDSCLCYLKDENVDDNELIKLIKAPDFPTGGIITDMSEIENIYKKGRGSITVRGKVEVETVKGKDTIVITELPLFVNKAKMIEKIADLVKEKRIIGITDIRDESTSEIRVVIHVKKGENINIILNSLYKYTELQSSFSVINLALINKGKVPKILSLREIFTEWVNHRVECIENITNFEVKKASDRKHILEGLSLAVKKENIENIIKIIRESDSTQDAQDALLKTYNLSEIQVKAILDMRLKTLTGLEVSKIEDEIKSLLKFIEEKLLLISTRENIINYIKTDLEEIKKQYAKPRKTEISEDAIKDVSIEDVIKNESIVVTLTKNGYLKSVLADKYIEQARGGKGLGGTGLDKDDYASILLSAKKLDSLLFFTNKGRVYSAKGYVIPTIERSGKGKSIKNFLPELADDEIVKNIVVTNDFNKDVLIVTKKGIAKKVNLTMFEKMRKKGNPAIMLDKEDDLVSVCILDENDSIFVATKKGKGIKLKNDAMRESSGKKTKGCKIVSLKNGDEISDVSAIKNDDSFILTITEKGIGRKTKASDYPYRNRATFGSTNYKTREDTGSVVKVLNVTLEDKLIMITEQGSVLKIPLIKTKTFSKLSYGSAFIKLDPSDKVVSISKLDKEDILENLDDEEIIVSEDIEGEMVDESLPIIENK